MKKTSANSSGRIGDFVTATEIAQHLHGRKSGASWVHDAQLTTTQPHRSVWGTEDPPILAKFHAECEPEVAR